MDEDRKSIELYRQEGENFRSVRATLEAETFTIDTQDMGKVVLGRQRLRVLDHRAQILLGPAADRAVDRVLCQ